MVFYTCSSYVTFRPDSVVFLDLGELAISQLGTVSASFAGTMDLLVIGLTKRTAVEKGQLLEPFLVLTVLEYSVGEAIPVNLKCDKPKKCM